MPNLSRAGNGLWNDPICAIVHPKPYAESQHRSRWTRAWPEP